MKLSEVTRAHLSKLLLMLGSTHDGEQLAAVAAIKRVLKTAGADLHDVADELNHRPSGKAKPVAPKTWIWREAVDELLAHASCCLTQWEAGFAKNLASYRGRPTDKQMDCVRRILERIKEKHRQAA
jgi:hypothetical protein